ncbi:hypothetical protein ACOBV9_19965 (plasmid) [Pseudoalteromonas espejiana]
MQAIETVAVTGLDSYHTSNKLTRLAYAKNSTNGHLRPLPHYIAFHLGQPN